MMEKALDACALIVTATAAYASTNVDGYALLLGFFCDRRYRVREVVAGQFISVATQLAMSAALVASGSVTEAPFLGLAGVVPLIAGLSRIADRRGTDARGESTAQPARRERGAFRRLATVTAVATSGAIDNVLVYASLLVGHTGRDGLAVACLFALLTALLCLCAFATARRGSSIKALHAVAERVAPFMATAVGVSLLIRFNTLPWIFSLA